MLHFCCIITSDRDIVRISDWVPVVAHELKQGKIKCEHVLDRKKDHLRKGGDYFYVQAVRCCLNQHLLYVVNLYPSIHLVNYYRFKKISMT